MDVRMTARDVVRRFARRLGYDIVRWNDPMSDMAALMRGGSPVVFDVGANVGQSVRRFRERFPTCVIHAFEPSPTTFALLRGEVGRLDRVRLHNCALGATPGRLELLENSHPVMSSFLPLAGDGWGEIVRRTEVDVRTVDEILKQERIDIIDILKVDTQGFDLQVLQGAEDALHAGAVRAIYCEVIFSDLYDRQASFRDITGFLADYGYELTSLYDLNRHRGGTGWADALFARKGPSSRRTATEATHVRAHERPEEPGHASVAAD